MEVYQDKPNTRSKEADQHPTVSLYGLNTAFVNGVALPEVDSKNYVQVVSAKGMIS